MSIAPTPVILAAGASLGIDPDDVAVLAAVPFPAFVSGDGLRIEMDDPSDLRGDTRRTIFLFADIDGNAQIVADGPTTQGTAAVIQFANKQSAKNGTMYVLQEMLSGGEIPNTTLEFVPASNISEAVRAAKLLNNSNTIEGSFDKFFAKFANFGENFGKVAYTVGILLVVVVVASIASRLMK